MTQEELNDLAMTIGRLRFILTIHGKKSGVVVEGHDMNEIQVAAEIHLAIEKLEELLERNK